MSKLVWLHLSDIHFLPNNEWQDSTARKALLKFLAAQLAEKQLKVDLVFCTGDIAFGELRNQSLSSQYTMAREFFDQVLKVCQCDKSRLFVVPGNHDIDRACITKAERKSWTDWGSTEALNMVDDIPAGFAKLDADTKAAMRRLEDWGKFVADYLPHQQLAAAGHHHYAQTITIAGRKIGIAGFNSAWTCAGDNDDRNLWLAAGPQFDHMRRELEDADLKIGLIHHPTDWFNLAERGMIKQRITVETHFWLHGHTHDAWVEPLPTHITLGAGAVTAGSQAEFGCNLVQLDFAAGRGRAHLFRYQKMQARWVAANDIAPDGGNVWHFALPDSVRKGSKFIGPVTGQERQRRLDAVAPRHARLESTIDVIVQVRMLSSPLLGKESFPTIEKPSEVVQDSRQVDITHPVSALKGQLLPAKLKVRVIAPFFTIAGVSEHLLEVPVHKYSEQVVFMLLPTRTGECRINIELFTVNDEHIKTIPLSTEINTDTGVSGYETVSLVVEVTEQIVNDIAQAVGDDSRLALSSDTNRVLMKFLMDNADKRFEKMPISSRWWLPLLLVILLAGAVGAEWPTVAKAVVFVAKMFAEAREEYQAIP